MTPRFAPTTFAVVFCVVYALVFWNNLPLFFYYPLHGLFAWGLTPLKGQGPGMAWYGFMVASALVGGFFALVVPDRLTDRILRNHVWLFPCATMLACIYLVRQFFLHG